MLLIILLTVRVHFIKILKALIHESKNCIIVGVKMARKKGNTIDLIFGEDDKKSGPGELNWLLAVGQIELRGLSDEQQTELFYKKIYEGLKRQKSLRSTPMDVAFDFYCESQVDQSIMFQKYKPIFSTPAVKKLFEKKAVAFLKGLSDAVHKLKSTLNIKQPKYFVPVAEMLGPKSLRLGFREGTISVTYDWENYETFGPYLLAETLYGCAAESLRFCQNCKKLFYSTHYKKVYCSIDCRNDEQSIKDDRGKIKDKLKSRRAYWAKIVDGDNAEIAKLLKDTGFIDTMRQGGFTATEIKRLIPTTGQYRRNTKRGK